jgi:hypothetical protein
MYYPLLLFTLVNLVFYSWIGVFHSAVPFSNYQYHNNANHYIQDPRVSAKSFSLINALGQYDSQWYLKIADKGYPVHPHFVFTESTRSMEGLLYNFFPLFPLGIAVVNVVLHNVQLSAFTINNLILIAIVYSLYFVVSGWFSKKVALQTILLVMIFPFSVFLRGYYSEGLRLLLFIWFCYGLTQKKYFLSAISVGLLCITSGISLLLLPFYYGVLVFNRKKIPLPNICLYAIVAAIPFLLWMGFCYIHTGDPFIFVATRVAWQRPSGFALFHNIWLLFDFPWLPVLSFYGSRMDVLVILLSLCLTILSKNALPKVVWWTTIIFVFSPLLVQDSVSFARFSSVFFPFFVYLSVVLNKKYYILLVCFFFIGLLVSSLYFINWYWIE